LNYGLVVPQDVVAAETQARLVRFRILFKHHKILIIKWLYGIGEFKKAITYPSKTTEPWVTQRSPYRLDDVSQELAPQLFGYVVAPNMWFKIN
jgi:hypothetical protein